MSLDIYLKQAISEELHNATTWLVILFTIIVPFVVSFIVKERYRKSVRCIGLLAFSLYGIYAMTLLDRIDSGASKLNFDLFWTWERALAGSALHQYCIVGNVLLFVLTMSQVDSCLHGNPFGECPSLSMLCMRCVLLTQSSLLDCIWCGGDGDVCPGQA